MIQIKVKTIASFCFSLSTALLLSSCVLPQQTDATSPAVSIYPAPEGVELSTSFSVSVEGQEVPVYKTKVAPAEPIPRLNGSRNTFSFASLASFDMKQPVAVAITYPQPVESVKILPTSFGITPRIEGQKILFNLKEPKHLTIEINGDWNQSLHLFANPPEENIPSPDDPHVIYFGPGLHEVTNLTVGSDTTIYLAGGAYIRGVMSPEEQPGLAGLRTMLLPTFMMSGTNITFRGRGIIDQSSISPRTNRRYSLLVHDAKDVKIEGITFLDPSRWTVPIKRSDNVHVDNIKIIGWRGNSDGVDISSCRDVLVENCFLRTLDDLIVVKSRTGQGESRNIHARKCVLWNELAHALSIGAELRENVSDVLFEDCDIIHDVGRETALRVYHCDDAVISNITFQNIRVEEARRLISVWIGKTRWTKTPERGHVRNVVFKDISATSAPIDPSLTGFQDGSDWKPYIIKDHASLELIGYDQDHFIDGVTFENVMLDGKKVNATNVTANAFIKNIEFK
jgi:hypothetical protein